MDDNDPHDKTPPEPHVSLFKELTVTTDPTARRRVTSGYFIEKPGLGYRFTLAGENQAAVGSGWRPTLRWAKATARRRLHRSRIDVRGDEARA